MPSIPVGGGKRAVVYQPENVIAAFHAALRVLEAAGEPPVVSLGVAALAVKFHAHFCNQSPDASIETMRLFFDKFELPEPSPRDS